MKESSSEGVFQQSLEKLNFQSHLVMFNFRIAIKQNKSLVKMKMYLLLLKCGLCTPWTTPYSLFFYPENNF